jgi:branched-chain amino acid transport system substrate-binding protein
VVRFFPRIAVAAIAAVALIGVAGCTADAPESSGDTVKIMVFGSFSQPPYPLPQIETGAQAAVDHINAEGGIDGTQIELVVCDDEGSANGSTACAQRAVQEGVAAVVGQFTIFGDAFAGVTEAAGIPLIFPTGSSQLEATSELSYPVVGAIPPALAAIKSFDEQGCESTVVSATDQAQARQGYDVFFAPVAAALGAHTEAVFYPADTTDFASVAAQIADLGDCVIYVGGAPDSSAIMLALSQSGADIDHQAALSTISFSEAALQEVGEASDGLQVFLLTNLPGNGDDVVDAAAAQITAIDADAVVDAAALNAYAAVIAFAQVATGLDEITSASVAEVLADPETVISTGIYPDVQFSEDAGFLPVNPRIAGSFFYSYIAEDGAYVPNEGVTTDLASLRDLLG